MWLGCVEGESCVGRAGIYDEPRASLAFGVHTWAPYGLVYLWRVSVNEEGMSL
jgi:hypothetical protein